MDQGWKPTATEGQDVREAGDQREGFSLLRALSQVEGSRLVEVEPGRFMEPKECGTDWS